MVLQVEHVSYTYPDGHQVLKDVSFCIDTGERVGLLAPSGYGKSTLAKIISGFLTPDSGRVLVNGKQTGIYKQSPIQLIYQHPEKAINPKWKMKKIMDEIGQPIPEITLNKLGLKSAWFERYPYELSGGELQRFMVARALTVQSDFIIADEISTMLDAVTQSEIWHFILEKIGEKGLIVISHNEHLLKRVCTKTIDLTSF